MVDIGEFLEMTRFKVLHHEDPCETALWHMFKQLNDEGFPIGIALKIFTRCLDRMMFLEIVRDI